MPSYVHNIINDSQRGDHLKISIRTYNIVWYCTRYDDCCIYLYFCFFILVLYNTIDISLARVVYKHSVYRAQVSLKYNNESLLYAGR